MTLNPLIAELNAALLAAYRRSGGGIRLPNRVAPSEPLTSYEGSVIVLNL